MKLATPQNSDWLRESGVVVPDALDAGSEEIRIDFTRVSGRAVGGIHSRFCNRLAYALYLRGEIEGQKLVLSRRLAERQARYRLRHEDEHKTMKSLEAAMTLSPGIKKISRQIAQLEVKEVALDAVIKGYEHVSRAASREMSRRGIEREYTSRD